MPENFPFPQWGQQSFDDRDLDSLLAGNTSDIPPALRPVADTLNALRATPSARELHGEAEARAQFRALIQGPPVAGNAAEHTLEIPAVPRHRHRATTGRTRHRPARRLFAGLAAATAAVIITAAYTDQLPGPAQQLAHDTIAAPPARHSSGGAPSIQSSSASPASGRTHPGTGGASSGNPSPSVSASDRKALCDQFWDDLEHSQPGQHGWRTPRYRALVNASGDPQKVFEYCAPTWQKEQYAPRYPTLPAHPPYFPSRWDPGQQDGGHDHQGQGSGQSPQPAASQPQPGDSGQPQPTGSGQPSQQQGTYGSVSAGNGN